jgi:hypothetical protein
VAATDAMSIAGARAKGLRNADNCRPALPSILPRSTERIPEQIHEALMPPGSPFTRITSISPRHMPCCYLWAIAQSKRRRILTHIVDWKVILTHILLIGR